MLNVLMTGAGAPGGPGIIKSLKRCKNINLHVADMDKNATGRFLNEIFYKIPSASEPSFIHNIKELCLLHQIDIVLPLVTKELEMLAKHRDDFLCIGTKIIVSSTEAISILNDKGSLYDFLKLNDLPHPEYYIENTSIELLARIEYFLSKGKACVIKPCIGNGSRGIRIIANHFDRYQLLFNEKPNSLYLNFDELALTINNKKIPKMVVSEYLSGQEVTVDTLINRGNLELLLIRRRLKMSGGISTQGEFILNDQIDNAVRELCRRINGINGPLGFQLKMNDEGFYHFIECNPRIQGTSVSAAGLGINIPQLAVEIEAGLPYQIPEKRHGVGFSRYYEEVFYDK